MDAQGIRIQIIDSNILGCIPEHYLTDGKLWVDVCGDGKSSKKLNVTLGENEIRTENTFPGFLKMTQKNKAIFGIFPCVTIECIIYFAGCQYDRKAYLFEVDLERQEYLIQWNFEDWRRKAERTSICDVFSDDDVIVWDDATVAHLVSNESYDDGTLLDALSSPLDYYGSLKNDTQPVNITREDLRLKINPKIIFERFFKNCGIQFKSPLYDSYFGSIQSRYLLKKEFWKYDGHGATGLAALSMNELLPQVLSANIVGSRPVVYQNILSGNTNIVGHNFAGGSTLSYENNTGGTQTIEACFSAKVTKTTGSNILGTAISFFGVIRDISNNEPVPNEDGVLYSVDVAFGDTESVNGRLKLDVPDGFRYLIEWNIPLNSDDDLLLLCSEVEYKVCSRNFYRNDEIKLNQILDCEKTVSDIFEAESQLFNFIPNQSQDESCVSFDIPFDTVIGEGTEKEETVRGFFGQKREANKMPGTSCGKDKLSCPTKNLIKRSYKFCFASTNDKAVSDMIESGEVTSDPEIGCNPQEIQVQGNYIKSLDNLFGLTIINDVNNSEKKEYCNECYEPTVMQVLPTNQFTSGDIPFLVEHYSSHHYEDDNGLCVGARATVNYLGTQLVNGRPSLVTFEGNELDEFLVSYQAVPNDVDLEREYNLTFDIAGENLFTLFYQKYINILRNSNEYTGEFTMTPIEFKSLDVSKYYCVFTGDVEIIIRILNTNFVECKVAIQGLREPDC